MLANQIYDYISIKALFVHDNYQPNQPIMKMYTNKTVRLLLSIMIMHSLFTTEVLANNNEDAMAYRRNSLCVGVISNPNASSVTRLIYDAAAEYQVSDKYNEHNIGIPVADLNSIEVTQQDINAYKKKHKRGFFDRVNSTLTAVNNTLAVLNGMQDAVIQDMTEEELTIIKLTKFLEERNVPALLVSKWFNANTSMNNGSYYDMSLIQERGAYNASELDILRSKEAIRGMSILKDAGMELIPNTYVILVSLKMETAAEVMARSGMATEATLKDLGEFADKSFSMKEDKQVAYTTYEKDPKTGKMVKVQKNKTISADKSLRTQMGNGINKALSSLGSELNKTMQEDARTTSGYYVTATTYLFKLKWDDEVEDLFLNKYYEQSPEILLHSNDFNIEFIDYSTTETQLTEKTSFEAQDSNNLRLVKRATMQAIDKSIAALQKNHEDFKVKAPIIDINAKDVTAFIGYKEGINSSTKFEVLERVYNERSNTYRYKKVGSLKVDNNRIWDNRYNLEGLPMTESDKEDGIVQSNVDRTYLKGSTKKLAPGMLIRQTK